jgi:hypothetical protein
MDAAASDDAHTTLTDRPTPYEVQTDSAEHLRKSAVGVRVDSVEGEHRDPSPHSRPPSGLQRQAWQWAIANRTPTGDLPSGRAIAERFGRRERWGRLVNRPEQPAAWTRWRRSNEDGKPVEQLFSSWSGSGGFAV